MWGRFVLGDIPREQRQPCHAPRDACQQKEESGAVTAIATPSMADGIPQTDGASDNTPTGRPTANAMPLDSTDGSHRIPTPLYSAPPMPPPMSRHLPKHHLTVIRHICFEDSHFLHYTSVKLATSGIGINLSSDSYFCDREYQSTMQQRKLASLLFMAGTLNLNL